MAIESLLRPRSIAVVGASETVGPGYNALKALEFVGFEGDVYPVNPTKSEVFGRRCYPSLDDLPGSIDAAFVSVGAAQVPGIARQAAAKGAGALAILSSGFGEAGPAGRAIQGELAAVSAESGLAICGPNCLGLLNFAGGAALFGTSLPASVDRGGVAAIVQSGSIGIALLNAARGLGLAYLVTSGNEAVTTTADYLEAMLDDEAVTTFIVFAEEIKQPARFIAAVRRARSLDKPVIVLKSGRSVRGQEAVMAHTGAVAGSVEACDAALAAACAIQVTSLDEMIETAILASTRGLRPSKRGIGVLSLSGGEIALAVDATDAAGLHVPPPGPVAEPLAALLPAFATIANPLDLTWAGLYDPQVARSCASTLSGHPDIGTLVLLQDAPHGLGEQQAGRYSRLLDSVAAGARDAATPLVAISNLSGAIHPLLAERAAANGVPYLRGTQEGFSALGRFAIWSTRAVPAAGLATDPIMRAEAARRLAGFTAVPMEDEARSVLAAYGMPGLRETRVGSPADAARAAAAISFPVVLKGLVAGIVHKSDAGLVAVGLRSTDEVLAAAERMRASADGLGEMLGFLVQEKASPVAEIFIGGRVDRDFGPLVAVGGGGVLVELYRDVAVRLAPISLEEALEALSETHVAETLRGFRGRPPGDLAAAAAAISALSRFIADFAGEVSEVEVNPLAVFAEGRGCSALDAVIVRQA